MLTFPGDLFTELEKTLHFLFISYYLFLVSLLLFHFCFFYRMHQNSILLNFQKLFMLWNNTFLLLFRDLHYFLSFSFCVFSLFCELSRSLSAYSQSLLRGIHSGDFVLTSFETFFFFFCPSQDFTCIKKTWTKSIFFRG